MVKNNNNLKPQSSAKPLIRPNGENRTVHPQDAALMAQTNPDLFQGNHDTDVNTSINPIKTHNPRINKKTNQKKSSQEQGIDIFSNVNNILNEIEGDTLSIEEAQALAEEPSTAESVLQKAKARYGYAPDEPDISTTTELYDCQMDKICASYNKKYVETKALEYDVLGYKTSIEQDFNGQWIAYRYPTISIDINKKDETFKKIGSGIYLDGNDDIWYLNGESNTKVLTYAGSLADAVSLKKPENYDLIKKYTIPSDYFGLEGSDVNYLFQQPKLMEDLGIQIENAENKIVLLTKYSKTELQGMFITYAMNVLVTQIYKIES